MCVLVSKRERGRERDNRYKYVSIGEYSCIRKVNNITQNWLNHEQFCCYPFSHSLSLSLSIYIYIYKAREREKERENWERKLREKEIKRSRNQERERERERERQGVRERQRDRKGGGEREKERDRQKDRETEREVDFSGMYTHLELFYEIESTSFRHVFRTCFLRLFLPLGSVKCKWFWSINETLTGTTIPSQSGIRINGNEYSKFPRTPEMEPYHQMPFSVIPSTNTHTYTHARKQANKHTHTRARAYIYIYIYSSLNTYSVR